MLQILLLTEKEVTALISMNQQIAIKVGLGDVISNQRNRTTRSEYFRR